MLDPVRLDSRRGVSIRFRDVALSVRRCDMRDERAPNLQSVARAIRALEL